jgi:hypothetical protein
VQLKCLLPMDIMSPAQTSKALPYSRVYPADVIDSAWDVPQAEVLAAARRRVGSLSGVLQEALAAFVILGIVFMLQAAAGAYRGERASYSDEASHFMNALLVRDYVSGSPSSTTSAIRRSRRACGLRSFTPCRGS